MIVLVDDDEIILRIYRAILERHGYRVKTFGAARDAFDYLLQENPELIISDISMPEINGFEFRQRYADQFPGRNTPFLFITGYASFRDEFNEQSKAGDSFLEKPVTGETLVAEVQSFLESN